MEKYSVIQQEVFVTTIPSFSSVFRSRHGIKRIILRFVHYILKSKPFNGSFSYNSLANFNHSHMISSYFL